MKYSFCPNGVCVTDISFEIDENEIVRDIRFENGCDGNLKLISRMLEGKTAGEITALCKGNTCDDRGTSCADQLSIAIAQALASPSL